MTDTCYIYQGAEYCEACGEAITAELDNAGQRPTDPSDEHTYDSGEYPKSSLSSNNCSDTPSHCANGEGCLQRIDLQDWTDETFTAEEEHLRYIGAVIGGLTQDGYTYAAETIAEAYPDDFRRLAICRVWLDAWPDITPPQEVIENAESAGADYGRAVGSWIADGNTTTRQLWTLATTDHYHEWTHPPLSGEYADDPTTASIAADADWPFESDEITQAYEDAYYTAAAEEAERTVLAQLPDPLLALLDATTDYEHGAPTVTYQPYPDFKITLSGRYKEHDHTGAEITYRTRYSRTAIVINGRPVYATTEPASIYTNATARAIREVMVAATADPETTYNTVRAESPAWYRIADELADFDEFWEATR